MDSLVLLCYRGSSLNFMKAFPSCGPEHAPKTIFFPIMESKWRLYYSLYAVSAGSHVGRPVEATRSPPRTHGARRARCDTAAQFPQGPPLRSRPDVQPAVDEPRRHPQRQRVGDALFEETARHAVTATREHEDRNCRTDSDAASGKRAAEPVVEEPHPA